MLYHRLSVSLYFINTKWGVVEVVIFWFLSTENILSMLFFGWVGGFTMSCYTCENAASFSIKTAYVDVHDNTVEMMSCTMLSVSISCNRNNL